jgi:hypothetical protein
MATGFTALSHDYVGSGVDGLARLFEVTYLAEQRDTSGMYLFGEGRRVSE